MLVVLTLLAALLNVYYDGVVMIMLMIMIISKEVYIHIYIYTAAANYH